MGMKYTEIGMIPEEWNVQSFADTFRILNNNTFSRSELNYVHGQFRNIHYGDVLILFPEVLDCSREDVPYINDGVRISGSAQPLQDGDIVMADTAEDETVGKVVEVTNTFEKPVMAGLHTIPCRVKADDFAIKWLGYYMNSHTYHNQLLPYIHGTKVSSVSKGSLGSTVILVPPIDEQKEIVSALSDIDSLIVNLQKLIRKKKDMRQACLQHMFPRNGQKAPDWRLPGFTGDWEQRKLGDVVAIYDGVHQTPEYTESGVMFLSVENITSLTSRKYISEEAFERDYKAYPQRGDILMTRIGDVGTPNVVETSEKLAFYVSLALLKPICVDSHFLCNAIQSPLFQKCLKDRTLVTAIPQKINKDEIGKVDVVLPKSLIEQKQIGTFFRSLDHLITLHQRKLEKYKMIKQGMMEELLTGKVRLV